MMTTKEEQFEKFVEVQNFIEQNFAARKADIRTNGTLKKYFQSDDLKAEIFYSNMGDISYPYHIILGSREQTFCIAMDRHPNPGHYSKEVHIVHQYQKPETLAA